MVVQKRSSPAIDLDPDATDVLPILEMDPAQSAGPSPSPSASSNASASTTARALPEASIATDVFPAPVLPVGMADLAASLREVEQRLARKIEKVRQLEAELGTANLAVSALRDQLAQAESAKVGQETDLQTQLADANRRIAALQEEVATLQRHHMSDLQQLRRRAEQQHEALSTWQGYRAVSEARLAESEARFADVETQHAAGLAALQSQLATVQQSLQAADTARQTAQTSLDAATQRIQELEAELATSRAAQATAEQQLGELRAVEDKARDGAARFDEQQQRIADLQAELEAATDYQRDTEVRLHEAGERLLRLEADAHASAALLGSLQQDMQRLGRDDTGSHRVAEATAAPLELRVLIRHEGGADVVYPLGRRTTVGRTAENDIQVDTTFVSRHHAVLLSNSDHCIVEDLNSTNGVLVNGRRVGRQILQDGDTVTIGKTEFRYQQRS